MAITEIKPNRIDESIKIQPDKEIGYRLTTEMFVRLPREEVFEFFSDARELGRITPSWVNFRMLTPTPVDMHEGTLLDYKIRLHGVPIKWRTEICVWEPCSRFVDQQVRGPYKKWYHEHIFESVEGGTLVKDNVHYIVPFGDWVNRLFVQPDLEKIFRFRHDMLHEIFERRIAERFLAPT